MSFGFIPSHNPAQVPFATINVQRTKPVSSSDLFGKPPEGTCTYTGEVQEKCTRVSVEWKIDRFREQYQSESWTLNSPSFCLSNKHWHISLQKNVKDDDENMSQTIRIYLKVDCSTSFPMCRVEYRIGIKKNDGTIYRCIEKIGTFSGNQSGCPWLLDHNDYSRNEDSILNENMLTVFCEASVLEKCDEEKRHQMISLKGLGENLKDLFLSGEDCDVKVKVKEQTFDCHRLILKSRSSVFAAMFQHDMTEKRSGIVEIADCEPQIFQLFLAFLYSGQLKELSTANVIELYKVAEKYIIRDLKTQCVEFTKREMSVDMICDFIAFAESHRETELNKNAVDFFIKNAQTILPTKKWQCFITEYPLLANELFIKAMKSFVEKQEL